MKVEVPFTKAVEAVGLRPECYSASGDRLATSCRCLLVPSPPGRCNTSRAGKGTPEPRAGSSPDGPRARVTSCTSSSRRQPCGIQPTSLRIYLIDLKTVEFAAYRDLPHR